MPTKSTFDIVSNANQNSKDFFSVIAMQSRGSISLKNVKQLLVVINIFQEFQDSVKMKSYLVIVKGYNQP